MRNACSIHTRCDMKRKEAHGTGGESNERNVLSYITKRKKIIQLLSLSVVNYNSV